MKYMTNINEYIGNTIECECGRNHSIDIDKIVISHDAWQKLAEYIEEKGYKHIYLVADLNTYEAAGKDIGAALKSAHTDYKIHVIEQDEPVPDEHVMGELFMDRPKDTDLVVAVGSGVINDMCKFISFHTNTDYVICGTAPSMDGFLSEGAPLMYKHMKISYDAHGPRAAFFDPRVLAAAPMELISAGLGDLLGKYTCLLDWKIAHLITGEYYCQTVVSMVESALDIVTNCTDSIISRDEETITALTKGLLIAGIAMYFVGNSRPASGCEHHMSHYWEMQSLMHGQAPAYHGQAVGVNAVVASFMYNQLICEPIDFEACKKKPFDESAWKKRVEACYDQAASGIFALEDECGKNNFDARNKRIDLYAENWTELVETVKNSLPATQEICEKLHSLGAPCTPKSLGIDTQELSDGIVLAKEVRNRYTLLQVLWDLGLLEEYSLRVVEFFEGAK